MSEDNQIVVPASFMALYVPPGKIKLNISRQLLIERYEFCEDLAQVLVEQIKTKQWELGISQDIAIERVAKGLSQATDLLSDAESQWLMTRLDELMQQS
jgi:hypothetical protein